MTSSFSRLMEEGSVMKQGWLKCRVLKGMFSDERAVVVRMKNGNTTSMFVPSSSVKGEVDHDGKVRVEVFEGDGAVWAVLPTEYRESVPINDDDVVPA